MAKGFIEIDAGMAIVILVATLTMMAALFLHSTSGLKEKVATFKQMEKIIEGNEENCVTTVALEENELRRVCDDYFS